MSRSSDVSKRLILSQKFSDLGGCSICQEGTYQDQDGHQEDKCKNQPTCQKGTYFIASSIEEERTCVNCPTGYYLEYDEHKETACERVVLNCQKGQYYNGTSEKLGKCTSCDAGQYRPEENHLETSCIPDSDCDGVVYEKSICIKTPHD